MIITDNHTGTKILETLHIRDLDLDNINNDMIETIMIPINSKAITQAIEPLIFDIASNCDWCYPDLEKTEIRLVADLSDSTYAIAVTVVPNNWTLEDVDGFYVTEDIALACMSYHRFNNTYRDDTQAYVISLTPKESIFISNILDSEISDILYVG